MERFSDVSAMWFDKDYSGLRSTKRRVIPLINPAHGWLSTNEVHYKSSDLSDRTIVENYFGSICESGLSPDTWKWSQHKYEKFVHLTIELTKSQCKSH